MAWFSRPSPCGSTSCNVVTFTGIGAGAYAVGLAATVIRLLQLCWGTYGGIASILLYLLCLAPVLAFGYPAALMYCILSGGVLAARHVGTKILAFIGLWIGGLTLGYLVDWICIAILQWIGRLLS